MLILHLHSWWSSPATCAGGVFLLQLAHLHTNVHKHIGALCNLHCVVVVVVVVVYTCVCAVCVCTCVLVCVCVLCVCVCVFVCLCVCVCVCVCVVCVCGVCVCVCVQAHNTVYMLWRSGLCVCHDMIR